MTSTETAAYLMLLRLPARRRDRGKVKIPVADRLARKLVIMDTGCIEWTGGTATGGYGKIHVNGKHVGTHRVAWELANGPIPDGLHVLHHCDNPPCCQTAPTEGYPEGHLFLGTDANNVADMVSKGRGRWQTLTHCKSGHPFDAVNTYLKPSGGRSCRACDKDRGNRYRARYGNKKADGGPRAQQQYDPAARHVRYLQLKADSAVETSAS